MKSRILLVSVATMLALSMGLIGCGGEEVPEYNLTISSTEGGSVTTPGQGTGSFTYDEGEVVDLVAVAEEGCHFVNWTGNVDTIADASAAATTITMNGDYLITANFQQIGPTALEQVIEAAEEEGELVLCAGRMVADAETLRNGIYDEFGVSLNVSVVSVSGLTAIGQMITEKELGLRLSYDFVISGTSQILGSLRPNDLQASIDWTPLFDEMGFSEDLYTYLPPPIDNIVTWTGIWGWVYNKNLISEEDLPQDLADVLDPQYDGRFAWNRYGVVNSMICYLLDMTHEEAVEWLCDIRVANGAMFMLPEHVAAQTALGTIDFGLSSSGEYNRVLHNDPDAPIGFAFSHDLILVLEGFWSVIEGCQHPNAAILAILWILTPDGQDWLESVHVHNANDPATWEYAALADAYANDYNVVYDTEEEDFLGWCTSEEAMVYADAMSAVIKDGTGCS